MLCYALSRRTGPSAMETLYPARQGCHHLLLPSCLLCPLQTQHQQRHQKPDLFTMAPDSAIQAGHSTTADSIGTNAASSGREDSTGGGASIWHPTAPESETEMDITTDDAPPSTPSTDDSRSPRSGRTNNIGQTWSVEVSDDSWVDDWDMTIHRCSHCDRPLVSAARLVQHVRACHTGSASALRLYRESPSNTDAGNGELVVIAPDGDLFLSVSEGTAGVGRRDIQFQVASPILWMASTVFHSMFGPKSRCQEAIALRRSNITGFPPVVVAMDDDPETLEYVLTALHFPYRPLARPAYELMVEIAAVCEKYELHRALKPVADSYLMPSWDFTGFFRMSNWLLISYVFGRERLFAAVTKHIIVYQTDAQQSVTIHRCTPAKVAGMSCSVPPSAGIISDQCLPGTQKR